MSDSGMTDSSGTGGPPDKAWAEVVTAWWHRKYGGRDPLAVWGNPTRYRLPSGQVVVGDTIARCKRFKAMGAERLG